MSGYRSRKTLVKNCLCFMELSSDSCMSPSVLIFEYRGTFGPTIKNVNLYAIDKKYNIKLI